MEEITADTLLNITKENNPQFILDNILLKAKEAAQRGASKIEVREYGFSNLQWYTDPTSMTEGQSIIDTLRGKGFKADMQTVTEPYIEVFLLVDWGYMEEV